MRRQKCDKKKPCSRCVLNKGKLGIHTTLYILMPLYRASLMYNRVDKRVQP
jgi:hypothetical protein